MRIPTPHEVGKLMAAAEVWFRPYIALCAFGGLRQGEAAAVKLDDIDFLRRQLKVTRQVQRIPGGGVGARAEIRAPKFNSERVVFLPEGLLTMLSEHVRTVGVQPEGWLFVGRDGPPLKTTVHRWWRKAVDGAGLSGITMHELRHFYASGLIANGCDVVTVQRAMGHSNATTTLATYSHLWPTAEERISKASEALMESQPKFLRTLCGLTRPKNALTCANTAKGTVSAERYALAAGPRCPARPYRWIAGPAFRGGRTCPPGRV